MAKKVQEEAKNIAVPGKNTKKTFSVKLGKEKFSLEEFCNYKSMLVLEMLGELSEKVDLGSIITGIAAARAGEDVGIVWAATMVKILPQALQQTPMVAVKLAALCLIPNKKLAQLYDEPNGIAEEIKRVEKLIAFQGKPGLPLDILAEALPYFGLEALKNGLTGLGGVLGNLLQSNEQTPTTG